jgi:hypothetical protein
MAAKTISIALPQTTFSISQSISIRLYNEEQEA